MQDQGANSYECGATFEFGWDTGEGHIFGRGWTPEGDEKAVVCLVHGIGEHSGRYAHVAEEFQRAGIALLSFDLLGHGRSEGARGHTPSLDNHLDNITRILTEAESRFPG